MVTIEDVARELLKIQQQLNSPTAHLEQSKNEIVEAMNRTQRTFGDQTSGQYIAASLSEAMKNLVWADSSLHTLKTSIEDYIRQINK